MSRDWCGSKKKKKSNASPLAKCPHSLQWLSGVPQHTGQPAAVVLPVVCAVRQNVDNWLCDTSMLLLLLPVLRSTTNTATRTTTLPRLKHTSVTHSCSLQKRSSHSSNWSPLSRCCTHFGKLRQNSQLYRVQYQLFATSKTKTRLRTSPFLLDSALLRLAILEGQDISIDPVEDTVQLHSEERPKGTRGQTTTASFSEWWFDEDLDKEVTEEEEKLREAENNRTGRGVKITGKYVWRRRNLCLCMCL